MNIPAYLFTGFLESGKTKFIQETLEDERFNDGTPTLILLCEEGIEEFDESKFPSNKVITHLIENEEDLSQELISSLIKKNKIKRILIEYNGMWKLDSLFENLPRNVLVGQNMLFVDSTTFLNYNNNMRSLVVDKLGVCDVVIFNRTKEDDDKEMMHKIVRTTSRRCDIIFEYTDGRVEMDDTEDPLPFDKNADIIVVKDEDFALFYRDISENTQDYDGKTVMFKGIIAHNSTLPKNTCLAGRHIMTCCEDDIAYGGMLCITPEGAMVNNRDWMMITAKVKFQSHKLYRGKGPVLYAEQLVHSPAPMETVATFY